MLNINSNPKMLYGGQRPFNGIHVLCLHRLDKADTTVVWPCVVFVNFMHTWRKEALMALYISVLDFF